MKEQKKSQALNGYKIQNNNYQHKTGKRDTKSKYQKDMTNK